MAKRITETLLCDAGHRTDTEAERTVSFALEGRTFELDLCSQHLGNLERDLGKWAELARAGAARRGRRPAAVGRGRGRRGRPRRATAAAPAGTSASQIRDWARAAGYVVSDRGRVSREILDAYQSAH
jgi:hypothetical protein